MSDISETSYWLKFFTEAGIPPSDATGYAITFTDNRIKEAMIPDINKEYLRDMGITIMGDIIAILKHTKIVSEQLSRQKAFSSPASSSTLQSATHLPSQETTVPPSKKSTAATRMLEHYVRKEPPLSSPSSSQSSSLSHSLSARLGGLKRPAEDEDSSQVNKRSSVFNRLGDNLVSSTTTDSPKITVTMLGKDKLRSGDESADLPSSRKSVESIDKSEMVKRGRSGKQLQYHGVLKYSAKELATQKLLDEKLKTSFPSSLVRLSKADTTSSIRSRLGVSSKPISVSEGIFANELQKEKKSITKLSAVSGNRLSQIKISPKTHSPNSTVGQKVIKKIVKINKKTGHIVGEERREVRSDVFNRLGNK